MTGTYLLDVYARLLAHYGPQGWWPAPTAWEVVVGAILTQHTSWTNVERALEQLQAARVLEQAAMAALDEDALVTLIHPAGPPRAKARALHGFLAWLDTTYDGSLARMAAQPAAILRPQLLALRGLGPETADCILLYVAGQPFFIADAYALRLFGRLGVAAPGTRYAALQAVLHAALPPDAPLFNEYHALIVAHGKAICTARAPRCPICPLLPLCAWGQAVGA